MLEDTIISIKEFITSYIETYQACINTANPDFITELTKSSNVIQDAFMLSQHTNKKGLSNDEYVKAEEGRIVQFFKQMLLGHNDLDKTYETSKQVKMHRELTQCYFKFVRRNVRDFVPKHIIYRMVNHVLDNIDHQVYISVFTPYVVNRSIDQLLIEDENSIDERIRAEQLLNAVNKALRNMMDIQCF